MGEHQKEAGRNVIAFLAGLGEVLGYAKRAEERMFPGEPNSPSLDLTWRLDNSVDFPLFIFEVESTANKSASDNALKVFSRTTPQFQKPLFFYHIFLDNSIGAERVDYLKKSFGSVNYDSFLLTSGGEALRLLTTILEQHQRLNQHLDLDSFLRFLLNQSVLEFSVHEALDWSIDIGYDRRPEPNFILTLESLIVE